MKWLNRQQRRRQWWICRQRWHSFVHVLCVCYLRFCFVLSHTFFALNSRLSYAQRSSVRIFPFVFAIIVFVLIVRALFVCECAVSCMASPQRAYDIRISDEQFKSSFHVNERDKLRVLSIFSREKMNTTENCIVCMRARRKLIAYCSRTSESSEVCGARWCAFHLFCHLPFCKYTFANSAHCWELRTHRMLTDVLSHTCARKWW